MYFYDNKLIILHITSTYKIKFEIIKVKDNLK